MRSTISGFLASVRRRGLSPATSAIYAWALRDLEAWLAAAGCVDVRQLDRALLEGWQDSLERLSPKSRSLAATAVRGCLQWAADRDLVDWRLLRAVVSVRTAKGLPRPIPQQDLQRIVAYLAPRRHRTERELRDRALFTLLLTTGARISEALSLQRAPFLAGDRPVVVQKGGGEKALLVTPTARQQLMEYLAVRRDDHPWLFVTTEAPRQQLGRQAAARAWKLLGSKVGVSSWTSHQVRHTCATEMQRAGISPLVIAEHLGHANLATLANYAAIVDEHQLQKVEALEGLLRRGVDKSDPDRAGFQAPVRIGRSRPDNRIPRGGGPRRRGRRDI